MVEKLGIEIALEGGEELDRQFKAATASIGKLGSTAEEAFAGASAAAQKFSASTQDLQKVEGVIKALSARARDSNTSFAQLAAGYDAARQSAGSYVAATAKVAQATKATSTAINETRAAVGALAQGLNVLGAGPLGRIATAIANVGARFGALTVAVGAVAGGAVALSKFAAAATETEKVLTQLQAVSGQSFKNLSALSNAFAQGGTPLKRLATEFGNLSEKIARVGEEATKKSAVAQQAKYVEMGLKATTLAAITLDERVTEILENLSRVPARDQWLALADIFKSLGSDMERAQIGKALGLSPETIATLSRGSAALQDMQQKAQQLGITLDAVDQKNLQGLIQSQNTASSLFDAIKEKMGALVAPAVSSFWEGFTTRLQELIPVFTNIASSIGQMNFSAIGAAAADFLAVIGKIATGWAAMVTGQASLTDVLGTMLQQAGQIAGQIGVAIGQGIIQGIISSVTAGIGSVWDAIKRGLGIGGSAGGGGAPAAAPGMAGGGLLGGRGTGTSDSNLAWVSRGEHIMPASVVRRPGVLSFLESLRRSGGIPGYAAGGAVGGDSSGASIRVQAIEQLKTIFDAIHSAMQGLAGGIDGVKKSLESSYNALDSSFHTVDETMVGIQDALARVMETLIPGGKHLARGGLLGGSGTGTSDSNLAWLSRGEYVTPARAVRQPGVLAFLEALRNSGGNLSRVLDGMGRFALGGLVPRAIPAYAAGGLAGGNNVTIQFPGLPAISGLRASSDVVDQLHKAAALAQVRSGGRKPSRYS